MTGWIFTPLPPLTPRMEKAVADRAADHRLAGPDVYQQFYDHAKARLRAADMLTLDDAAARYGLSPEDYEAEAVMGKALLLRVEDVAAVPVWMLTGDAAADGLRLDIAREFGTNFDDKSTFTGPMKFLTFMAEETIDIAPAYDVQLRKAFAEAGLPPGEPSFSYAVPVTAVIQPALAQPALFRALIRALDGALSHGDWGGPQDGGLSAGFAGKYGVPLAIPARDRWLRGPAP